MRESDLKQRPARHISLAKKALMVFTALMLGQLLVSFLILQWVVAPAFVKLEDTNTRENSARVRAAIQTELSRLNTINRDWSSWDSTYTFAVGNNPEFIAENLPNDVLEYLQLDWMLFLDADQTPLWERFSQVEGDNPRTLASLFESPPTGHSPLFTYSRGPSADQNFSGHILATRDGPMLTTSMPILRNEGAGTSVGTVIVGRLLSSDFVQQTASRLMVDFSITDSDSTECPEGHRCELEPIIGIDGKRIGQFQVRTLASVTQLGSNQVSIALQLLALTGLAYLLAVSALTRRIILAPMTRLAEHIRHVTRTGDLTQRLHVAQRDEIGLVVGDLNAMTNSLERADNQVRRLAYNDPLTGLPNRRELDEQLRKALDGEGTPGPGIESLTLLFIDLDRFKRVNDLLSHEAGDELLVIAARRLRSCLRITEWEGSRPADGQSLLARIGGDEFVVAMYEEFDAVEIRQIAQRVISRLEKPIVVKGEMVNISASVGISSYPRDAADSKTLIRNADIAMYRAKEVGGGTFHVYNDDADSADKDRVELARDLRYALEKDQLALYYQPQVDIRTNRIIGCEALIRWHHPERGLVLPGEIISLAEEDGSIEGIGRWAIHEACDAAQRWQNPGHAGLKVSVNVSPRQLSRGNLVKDVLEALHRSKLDPGNLILEVTESGVMRNTDVVVQTLAALKQLGITIAMDDFGTGYSSLGYLRRLPIDLIKIDRMFIEELATDPEEAALVAAIVSMAGSLRREVMAEGVETQEQVDLLQAKGCHLAQGYFFGAPCPADEFRQLLKRSRRDKVHEPKKPRQWQPGRLEALHDN